MTDQQVPAGHDISSTAMRQRSLNAARNAEQYLGGVDDSRKKGVPPDNKHHQAWLALAQYWADLARTYADLSAVAQREEHRWR